MFHRSLARSLVLLALTAGCDLPPDPSGVLGGTWGEVLDDGDLEGGSTGAGAREAAPDGPVAEPGRVQVSIHGSQSEMVDEVWVRFDRVEALHETLGWFEVSDTNVVTDLASATAQAAEPLGRGLLPTGRYSQLSVRVREAWVVAEGETFPLEMRAADRSGLEIEQAFEVPECGVLEVVLDWDIGAQLTNVPGFAVDPSIEVSSLSFAGSCGARGGGGTGGPSPEPEGTGDGGSTGGDSDGGSSSDSSSSGGEDTGSGTDGDDVPREAV